MLSPKAFSDCALGGLVEIVGARGKAANPEARLVAAREMGDVQLLDARVVCGRDHLLVASEHAKRAVRNGTKVANSLAVEFVLFASGERQISGAIAKMGIRQDTTEFAVVVFAGDAESALRGLGLSRDDTLLDATVAKLHAFGVTEAELASVPTDRQTDLVLERVALVDLLK